MKSIYRAFALLCAAMALAVPLPAMAQSYLPFFAQYGYVPTAGQWVQAWQAKQDVLGYIPINKAGDIMLGGLGTIASTAAGTGFDIPPGVAPSSPNNGDMWTTPTGLFFQINGSTVQAASSTATAASVTVGNPVLDGTLGGLLLNNAGNLGNSAALGTDVLPALEANIGTAGAPVLFNGAGGTPSAINLANATALPLSGISAISPGLLGYAGTGTGAPVSLMTLPSGLSAPNLTLTGSTSAGQSRNSSDFTGLNPTVTIPVGGGFQSAVPQENDFLSAGAYAIEGHRIADLSPVAVSATSDIWAALDVMKAPTAMGWKHLIRVDADATGTDSGFPIIAGVTSSARIRRA